MGIILLLLSCKKEEPGVDADRIFSFYELKYDQNKDRTFVKALLRLDGPEGDLIELSEPAEISFNGDQLVFNPENREHQATFAYLVDSGSFKYLNSDGKTIINSTPKLEKLTFPFTDPISRNRDLVVKWMGAPVGKNETVQLTLEGSDRAATFQSSEEGEAEIIVPASEIKTLDRFGSGTYKLQRIYIDYMNTGTATGGTMTMKYITDGYVQFRN